MKTLFANREGTPFYNEFLKMYLEEDSLADFRSYNPSLDSLKIAIEGKKSFPQVRRDILSKVLLEQYAASGIQLSDDLKSDIISLKSENTFTITTGQQIHLGLGPLYVLYKAFDTIALAREAKKKFPDYSFIPIFWMATEDHDLEEIARVPVFGNVHTWETSQNGPVGRMTTEGVSAFFQQIRGEYRFSESQELFISLCEKMYEESANLSIAFRKILHHYVGHQGLIILDADNIELKNSFCPVLIDELQHKNFESLATTTRKLENLGVDAQLHIRECGLFDMRSGERKLITEKYSADYAEKMVQESAFNLSPNAAFRPLYEEWILPNLIYVGGPSEIKYWMQLKGLFTNYALPMPILHLRTSAVLIPHKMSEKYSDEEWLNFFSSKQKLIESASSKVKEENDSLLESYNAVCTSLDKFQSKAEATLPGLKLEGKVGKISPKLVELKSIVDAQMLRKVENNPELNKVLKIKDKFFLENSVQERSEHVLTHIQLLDNQTEAVISNFGSKKSQKIRLLFV